MAFIAYDRTLQTLVKLKPLLEQLRRHERSLADQMQRAAQSTFLNIAEGRSARGRNEAAKFQLALTECREARAALQLAVVWDYIDEAAAAEVDGGLDQVAAILWTLVHRPRRAA